MKKKILMAVACLFLSATGVFAQQRQQRSPEEQAKMRVEHLDKLLSLNQTQKDSIYNLTLSQAQQRAALRNDGGDRKASMEKFKQLQEIQTTKIKSWLTPDQAKLFDEQQEKMKERMSKRSASTWVKKQHRACRAPVRS
jgi:DNA gyrase/topoisomerase IV subunit A